jgi:uncharacterized membrane protein HdeD (DUF308 family)
VIAVAIEVVWEVTTLEREGENMVLPRSVGMILLAIWLILTGLITLFNLVFPGVAIIMGILALIAGILILAGR